MRRGRLTGLLACAALAIGLIAVPTGGAATADEGSEQKSQVRVLQLNLCNSGMAHCFTEGKHDLLDHDHDPDALYSEHLAERYPKALEKHGLDAALAEDTVTEAVQKIKGLKALPDVITLNEVCEQDVAGGLDLESLKSQIGYAGDSFFPVENKDGDAQQCAGSRGGGDYGSAILTKEALDTPYPTHRLSRVYDEENQYSGADERRSMGCRKMPWATVCTTQLNNLAEPDKPEYDETLDATEAQCKQFMEEATDLADGQPVVLAGDLNLRWNHEDQKQRLKTCIGTGNDALESGSYTRKSDDDLQHVVTTGSFVADVGTSDFRLSDHPTLWAKLKL